MLNENIFAIILVILRSGEMIINMAKKRVQKNNN